MRLGNAPTQRNQEPLVVKDNVEDRQVSLGEQVRRM